MPVSLNELNAELNYLLKPEQFNDYCPNGLQVEGRKEVNKIVSGVTACRALIEAAIEAEADLILVHHGYFWKGEDQTITGLKKSRIQLLLQNDLSLSAYHLPLDAHKELGNNVQLAKILEINIESVLDFEARNPIVFSGRLNKPMSFAEFSEHVGRKLDREPLTIQGASEKIETIAWCTGAAQNFIELAVEAGVDAYLTGDSLDNSGYLEVTVSPQDLKVDYIRSWLPQDEVDGRRQGEVAYSYSVE